MPAICLICKRELSKGIYWTSEVEIYLAATPAGEMAVVCGPCWPTYRNEVNPIITAKDLEEAFNPSESE